MALSVELIIKKRMGLQHSREEIHQLVAEFAEGRLPDYQMAAWLMAVYFSGMSAEETLWLTEEMRDSGAKLDLSSLQPTVDKHSTGGLGDKTSLLLVPIVAAAGLKVPMMAGRGLGHTGGTIDKLESLAGFRTSLSLKEFQLQVGQIDAAIVSQSVEICPADRKLYALRDVTGTVESLPLICGSIMSKKLAVGMQSLVLDVKFGSGAFMKSLADAEKLGRALKSIGEGSGQKIAVLLTRMDEPLGRYIGNALEVKECLDILQGQTAPKTSGKDFSDTIELTLALAGQMIHLADPTKTVEQARSLAQDLLKSGAAYKKFLEICKTQGAEMPLRLPEARHQTVVTAQASGWFQYVDLVPLGWSAIELGAGRKTQQAQLDLSAGIEVLVEPGQRVETDQPLFVLYANDKSLFSNAISYLNKSYTVSQQSAIQRSPLIAKVIL